MDLMSIYFQNVRGLKSKTIDILNSVLVNNYDIICLCETWLDDSVASSELFDERYTIYRRDRSYDFMYKYNKSHGGGVLIAVKKCFLSFEKVHWKSPVEDIWVCVRFKNVTFNICTVYLPSYLANDVFIEFLDNCERILQSSSASENLIIGDFNIPGIDWSHYSVVSISNARHSALQDFLNRTNLSQRNFIKNNNDRILDLVLCQANIYCKITEPQTLSQRDSHHPPLELSIKTDKTVTLKEKDEIKYRFCKTDFPGCIAKLSQIDWYQYTHLSCDDFLQVLYTQLWDCIDKYTPKTKTKKNYPPWFSYSLLKILKEKDRYHKKYKKYGNPRDFDTFSMLRSRAKITHDASFKSYICRMEDGLKNNVKLFWSYIKSKRNTNDLPKQMSYGSDFANNGNDIADLFAKYFATVHSEPPTNTYIPDFSESYSNISSLIVTENEIESALKSLDVSKGPGPDGIHPLFIKACTSVLVEPLCKLFNKSLSTGDFPSLWKKAIVVPIHKSGRKSDVTTYRPINMLCCFSKIFESLVYKHINLHLKHIISPRQNGFVKGRSTSSNLLSYVHYLSNAINKRIQVDALYTDFSKAFDKVDHNILIRKAYHNGIHGSLLRWLTSYLSNRTQIVKVYGYESAPFETKSGVPQGSNLGPLLFILFINDLINSISCNCLAYADDIKIYREVKSDNDCSALQDDINRLYRWCVNNNMSLNISKCLIITFTKNKCPIHNTYKINNTNVARQNIVKDLGVLLDSKLSFTDHYDCIISKANKAMGFIFRTIKPLRNPSSILTLFFALVRSIVEYCSVIWSPFYKTHIDRIEAIQRRFLRYLSAKFGLRRKLSNYEARLEHFKVSTLQSRRNVASLSTLYKIINSVWDAEDLLGHFSFNTVGSKRTQKLFSIPLCRNNVSHNNPVFQMCRTYNSICKELDIFSLSHSSYLKICKSKL